LCKRFGWAPYFVREHEMPLWLMGGGETRWFLILFCGLLGVMESVMGKMMCFLLLKYEREIFQGGLGHNGFFWGGCLACFSTCKQM
jgi:hypothetical protein